MEQKFKVWDLVRCIEPTERPFNRFGTIVLNQNGIYFVDFGSGFDGHVGVLEYNKTPIIQEPTGWNLKEWGIELAYPSDHDLLDFAACDSKIAELTAENEALKAELEKYKPKPESKEVIIYLVKRNNGYIYPTTSILEAEASKCILARKTVTITEGEGM